MLETILLLEKENYQKLKWVNQFATHDLARPNLRVVYILGASLVTSDGFSLGRIDIPAVLKDYCKGKKAFEIIKLATSPYLAVLEEAKFRESADDGLMINMADSIAKLIEGSKDVAVAEQRVMSIRMDLLKRITTMPDMMGIVDLHVKETTGTIIAVTKDGYSILMPVHVSGQEPMLVSTEKIIKKEGKLKLTEYGKEFVKGVEPKKEKNND